MQCFFNDQERREPKNVTNAIVKCNQSIVLLCQYELWPVMRGDKIYNFAYLLVRWRCRAERVGYAPIVCETRCFDG